MATLRLKVVPGARRDRIVGRYGDALKVQVSAPPEQGKANQAVVFLIAEALDVEPRSVVVRQGHASARKVIEIGGVTQEMIDQRLAIFLKAAAQD